VAWDARLFQALLVGLVGTSGKHADGSACDAAGIGVVAEANGALAGKARVRGWSKAVRSQVLRRCVEPLEEWKSNRA